MLLRSFNFITYLPLIFLVYLFSCQPKERSIEKQETVSEIPKTIKKRSTSHRIDLDQYRLYHTIDQVDLRGFKKFGTFFGDRLSFYFLDDPEMSIGKANVHFLMLYFMDDRLVKVRYHIDDNISNYLVDSLGMCKIRTSDAANKTILETGSAVIKNKRGIRLNPALDNYELIWDRYVVETRLVVDPDQKSQYNFKSVPSNYVYIDQLKSYKRRISELEKSLNEKADKPS